MSATAVTITTSFVFTAAPITTGTLPRWRQRCSMCLVLLLSILPLIMSIFSSSKNSAGTVVYITICVLVVITITISSSTWSTENSHSSHTSVIVGAVVGGVAGIITITLLFLCIRRKVRKDEFDGNFDTDHVMGLTDSGGGSPPMSTLQTR